MLTSKANWIFTENENNKEPFIDQILAARGMEDPIKREQFLHPNLENVTSPKMLHDISKAKGRIIRAIENDENILVYGDYDADGVTSTALLMKVLIDLGAKCDYYIPNRFKDGYGINEKALKMFHENQISLVITVDTGIANIEEADIATILGIDLIITDHHEIQQELPNAYAIIHPQLSPDYPFKSLAGVGVAFQLAHYLLEEMPTHLLELVAIGTVADLVPLLEDNRIFVHHGLQALNSTSNIGLQALYNVAKLNDKDVLTERDIGFMIAPRLNAVGRLQDATLAVDLLLTSDETVAAKIAEEIEQLNIERQEIVQDIVKDAEKRIHMDDKIIMLYDEQWHEGVLGIAASRLVKKYNRPVMMLTYKEETNELKGSARSIPAFHLFQNGMQIKYLFTQFGGHSQAAGMTFPFENFSKIKNAFHEAITEQLKEDDYKQEIKPIMKITIHDMTEHFVEQINMLAPFGMENEEPVFHIEEIPTQIRQIGQQKNHLKIQFKEETHVVDAIGFQFGHLFYFISEHTIVSIVGKLQINEWNGNKTVQLLMEDIAVFEWQLFDYRSKKQDKFFHPYFLQYKTHLIIGSQREDMNKMAWNETIEVMTYDQDVDDFPETEMLYVYDLPNDLTILEKIVEKTNPLSIHVSYGVTDNAFLESIPPREDFKWVYGFIVKYEPIQLKVDLIKMLKIKGWKKEKVFFIIKVFLDLKFIYVKDDQIYIQHNSVKRSLSESSTYQKRLKQSKIEQTLYYSTYDDLKEWFNKRLPIREEIVHGL